MTTTPQTNLNKQLPDTTLDWFKTHAFTELEKMRYTPSVQIALRQHLRLTYWLSKCQLITPEGVKRACKAIAVADTPEDQVPVIMAQSHVDAVLCQDQGFVPETDPATGEVLGWTIPEMLGMLDHANQSYQTGAHARTEKAKKAAEARWSPRPSQLSTPAAAPAASRMASPKAPAESAGFPEF